MDRPIAYMGDQPYIFVSYSHKDCERVWPIILKLQDEGFRIWYDDGISPGTEWDANIATHIRKCAFFAAFISRNYLESENCKDELSFVRELGKNRVLIYLEEVVLPDELQMRLGRLQAIYWNRDGEKKAYKKFMQSPGVNVCKEPVVPVEPPHEEPAAPPSVAEVPAQEPEKAAPVKTVAPAKSAAPAKASAPKKSPILFVGIGVVVLLIAILALRSMGSNQSGNNKAFAQDGKELTGAYSVYSKGVANNTEGSLLAGVLVADDPYNMAIRDMQELDYKGDTYTVAQLPFTTISSFDNKNSIILGFHDNFDGEFYFYGTYSIDGETLTVSPGGSSGSFSQDCAPLTNTLTYTITVPYGDIRLTCNDRSIDYNSAPNEDGILILRGALSEGSEPFEGVQSLDLVLDVENNELKKCVLLSIDGESANVESFTYWDNIHDIDLRVNSLEYIQNGRPVTEDVYGTLDFKFINQYPAGFTIIDTSEDTVHYYQNLSDF